MRRVVYSGLLLLAATLHAEEAPPATRPGHPTESLDIKWVRDSAEYQALTRMVYALATRALPPAGAPATKELRAVVLDLDETALDNSVFQLERIAYGLPYDVTAWNAWCERRAAGAVPGALDFVQAARARGLRVAWISDRREVSRAATRANVVALGLWAEGDVLCLKNDDAAYNKAARRRELREGTGACSLGAPASVVAYVGDQLGDFPGPGEPSPNVQEADAFGRSFFLLPNPMYGLWANAVTRKLP